MFIGHRLNLWTQEACDPIPILHALFRTAIPRRGICGQPLPRLPVSLTPEGRSGPTDRDPGAPGQHAAVFRPVGPFVGAAGGIR